VASHASRYSVVPDIHDEDGILGFTLQGGVDREEALRYYFQNGADSAAKLERIAEQFLNRAVCELTLLEFASGSGRVTRHLVNRWNDVSVCEIQDSALIFLEEKFGVTIYKSSNDPGKLKINEKFDVVFALSFFSHMPRDTFARWLVRLSDLVAPQGLFVFTTHGQASIPHLARLGYQPEPSDFWFSPVPSKNYGQTIVSHSFTERERCVLVPDMQAIDYREAEWDGHQDIYVWRRK
jgi:cyclopropane fatty-acyl-phospholipid synthase-like methyltransferase